MFEITLRSGTVLKVDGSEMKKLKVRMGNTGRNFPRIDLADGTILFLEHIELIKPLGDVKELLEEDKAKPMPINDPDGTIEAQRANQAKIAELERLSNCEHPEDEIVYNYMIMKHPGGAIDKKTGKAVTQMRYFTTCGICGGNRSRYIAADKLTDEQKAGAVLWEDRG